MRNWAGNLSYRARRLLEPRSVEELQENVAGSSSLRPLGTRHSFNDIADTKGDLVSLARLPRRIEVDRAAARVVVDGGARLGEICSALHATGLALPSLPSLPHISAAGACATATHGSGDRSANVASSLTALEVVRADGELAAIRVEDPDGLRADGVGLGALGIAVALEFQLEPAYDARQVVYEGLSFDAFMEHFDEIVALGDSVSFMTDWRRRRMHQVWVKRRVAPAEAPLPLAIHGATAATRELHPIPGLSAEACTPQLGLAGPWHERLPHFRLSHTPSSGRELQSEYLVPRGNTAEALHDLEALRERLVGLVYVTEIRTVSSDDFWLSPATGRASTAFHFTWRPDPAGVAAILPAVEAVLGRFGARPHWGKVFMMTPDELRSRYPRLPDFAAYARRLDPTGKLANEFLRRYVLD